MIRLSESRPRKSVPRKWLPSVVGGSVMLRKSGSSNAYGAKKSGKIATRPRKSRMIKLPIASRWRRKRLNA